MCTKFTFLTQILTIFLGFFLLLFPVLANHTIKIQIFSPTIYFTQQGKSTSSVRMMKGKDGKGNKPKGLIARRNSKKLLERKKQEEEAQRRAASEEDKHKLSEQGGQQNGVDGKSNKNH